MNKVFHFPHSSALTRLLLQFDPRERLEKRRRIEAIARRQATRLISKYGNSGALDHCRRKLVYCVSHAPGVREQIWNRVYNHLRPPGERRDNWRRAAED